MDLLEGQPDLPGTGGLEIAAAQALDAVALARREVGGVLEPGITGSLQLRPPQLFLAADLIDGIVDDLDGVELVEGDCGLRQVLGGAPAQSPDPGGSGLCALCHSAALFLPG